MDLPTLRRLRQHFDPLFITGLGNRRYLMKRGLSRVEELDWWQSASAPGGLTVTMTPAQHFSRRGLFDRLRTLWGGFMLTSKTKQMFFTGDSAYGDHFHEVRRRLGCIDLALLPIGAYEPRWLMQAAHMNPQEAVRAHLDLAPRVSLGMHFWHLPAYGRGHRRAPRGVAPESMATRRQGARFPRAGFWRNDRGRLLT